MESADKQPTMNRKIFELGLPTEAVSLYILCCHLQDSGTTMSRSNIAGLWNGREEALAEGISDLEERQILARILTSDAGIAVYQINDIGDWKG